MPHRHTPDGRPYHWHEVDDLTRSNLLAEWVRHHVPEGYIRAPVLLESDILSLSKMEEHRKRFYFVWMNYKKSDSQIRLGVLRTLRKLKILSRIPPSLMNVRDGTVHPHPPKNTTTRKKRRRYRRSKNLPPEYCPHCGYQDPDSFAAGVCPVCDNEYTIPTAYDLPEEEEAVDGTTPPVINESHSGPVYQQPDLMTI